MTDRSPSFQLREFCVDTWRVDLACCEENLASGLKLLSGDEVRRADCIGSEPMRRAFVLARIALRLLLGHYLDREPGRIQFTCGTRGKPVVCGDPDMCFSASRSGRVAAFAFALKIPIGIDVEEFRVVPQMDRVVKHMFSGCERRQLSLLKPDELPRAFLTCWTRKEAYAKATGDGILNSFDKFCVDANPHERRPRIHFDGVPSPTPEWSVHGLCFGHEHAAALAYPGAERAVSMFEVASVEQLLLGDVCD